MSRLPTPMGKHMVHFTVCGGCVFSVCVCVCVCVSVWLFAWLGGRFCLFLVILPRGQWGENTEYRDLFFLTVCHFILHFAHQQLECCIIPFSFHSGTSSLIALWKRNWGYIEQSQEGTKAQSCFSLSFTWGFVRKRTWRLWDPVFSVVSPETMVRR